MTDVRLTATNPEDSSVVPVACNDKGELKLEEPIVFDGNLDGALTVTGNGTFGSDPNSPSSYGVELESLGRIDVRRSNAGDITFASYSNTSDPTVFIRGNGTATFSGNLIAGKSGSYGLIGKANSAVPGTAAIAANQSASGGRNFLGTAYDATSNATCEIFEDGSARFANNKAGFTADGFLWCTTERGDTVYLQGTSNGMGLWVEYTPPSLKDLIEDKLEEWSEEDHVSEPDKHGEGQT